MVKTGVLIVIVEFLSNKSLIVRHKDSVNLLFIGFNEKEKSVYVLDSQFCDQFDEYIGG